MFVKEQAQREQECNITSVKLLLNSQKELCGGMPLKTNVVAFLTIWCLNLGTQLQLSGYTIPFPLSIFITHSLMKTDFCIFDLKTIKMWKRFSQPSLENNISYLLGLGYTCINVYSDILTDIYIVST